jgi:hypothetical protein
VLEKKRKQARGNGLQEKEEKAYGLAKRNRPEGV